MITDYMTPLIVSGVPAELCASVHEGLYRKRQGLSEVEIDIDKMVDFYKAKKEHLIAIIRWYESNLLSTKFIIK